MARTPNFHCYLTDKAGQLIYSTLDPKCAKCPTQCNTATELLSTCGIPGKRRRGIRESAEGRVFLCSADPDDVKSAKRFKHSMDFFSAMLLNVADIKKHMDAEISGRTKRVLHNLTSLNAHSIQELYAFAPQEVLTAKLESQLDVIESYLQQNTREAAQVFLRILKNEINMKTEFSVFRKLYDPSPSLRFDEHAIHKVLLNVFHIFFSDFADKRVRVAIDPCTTQRTIDYESFHVALFHLVENATKYVLPGSTFYIRFPKIEGQFSITLSMISVYMTEADVPRLFEEGYSGEYARKCERAGDGIGMALTKELLRLNGCDIIVSAGARDPTLSKKTDIPYAQNSFQIIFRRKPAHPPIAAPSMQAA